jgi:hypothetical protein
VVKVDPADRHDAAGGRGDEHLLGGTQAFGRQGRHGDRHAEFAAQFDGGPPGDAFEHAAVGRKDPAGFEGEDVEAGALGDVSGQVGEHDVLRALIVGLEQPGDDVEPVVVLDRGIDGLDRDALDRGDRDI